MPKTSLKKFLQQLALAIETHQDCYPLLADLSPYYTAEAFPGDYFTIQDTDANVIAVFRFLEEHNHLTVLHDFLHDPRYGSTFISFYQSTCNAEPPIIRQGQNPRRPYLFQLALRGRCPLVVQDLMASGLQPEASDIAYCQKRGYTDIVQLLEK